MSIERLGEGVHNILSDLTKRLVATSDILPNGNYEIRGEVLEGWLRQSGIPFQDLCDVDRQLNREITEKYFGDLIESPHGES